MGILVIENGVKTALSNDAFMEKYGEHPQVARFSRQSVDIILEHINERQDPRHFTHDLNWQTDFSIATVTSYRDIFDQCELGDTAFTDELLSLVADTISLKVSLLDNPKKLNSMQLLTSIKPILLENTEYTQLASDYIVEHSHHCYREVVDGWLRLTL